MNEKKRKRIDRMQLHGNSNRWNKISKNFLKNLPHRNVCIYISLPSSTALSLHSFHYLHIAMAIHCTFVCLALASKLFYLFHFDVATTHNVETNIIMFHGRANPVLLFFFFFFGSIVVVCSRVFSFDCNS